LSWIKNFRFPLKANEKSVGEKTNFFDDIIVLVLQKYALKATGKITLLAGKLSLEKSLRF